MIQVHEAQRLLVEAGYEVDLQPRYKNLTILNATYKDVKRFLQEHGYDGEIIVIGPARSREKTRQETTSDAEYEQLSFI